MYTTTYSYNGTTPTAHVTVRKNRVKQYGSTPIKVYLRDSQEFEIELFNPKTTPVMAKIKLNGSYISTKGIYLKPGQRIYLDRFIDSAQKLLFSTYEVEANDSAVAKAIANNGDLVVEFYDEVVRIDYPYWLRSAPSTGDVTWGSVIPTNGIGSMDIFSTSSSTFLNNTKSLYSKSIPRYSNTTEPKLSSVETGRVEAGAASNQKFEQSYGDFNTWYSTLVMYKILPDGQEPVTIQQVTTQSNFCGGCGTKITKSHYKFCPNCGEKLHQ